MIGRTISHYKIVAELGGGGMGVVYRAIDTKLDRPVALKFLPSELTGDPDSKRRFIREAKTASTLQHPNICTIHEIDETDDGRMFICMDCYEGEDLKKKIASGPLSVDGAVKIVTQVAEGLAKAHEVGIVHRDIKPANVVITNDGVAKILDFGLAKLAGQSKVTKTGTTVGTAAYMSPEQARGEDVDARSDVFSLGCVLYELLTGKSPYSADHEAAVMYKIMHDDPVPITMYRNDVPDDVLHILSKATQKDPARRYQNGAEMASDLKRFREGVSRAGRVASRTDNVRRRNFTIAAASFLVLLAIVFGYFHYMSSGSQETADTRKMIAVLPFENLGPAEDEYFSDGMTEEILTRLAAVEGLGVIARTSVMQYKDTRKTIRQIGDELGVDYILEGTVRWQMSSEGPNRVRVNPQLILVSDETHLWAEIYDDSVSEIFRIQSQIADQIAQNLNVALGTGELIASDFRTTSNFEAYTYYLRAREYHTSSIGPEKLKDAERYYLKAVQLDSSFALAYARLAQVHAELYWIHYDHSAERRDAALTAAKKAMQIWPNLPDAHRALAECYFRIDLDYERALEEIAIAQIGQPDRFWDITGYIQRRQGKWEEAVESLRKASTLDPGSIRLLTTLAETYQMLRNYSEAMRYFERAIAFYSDESLPSWKKNEIFLLSTGSTEQARKYIEEVSSEVAADKLNEKYIHMHYYQLDMLDADYQGALDHLTSADLKIEALDFRELYIPMALTYAEIYAGIGELRLSYAHFDSARSLLESKMHENPDDARVHSSLGIVYAGLGRYDDAVEHGKLAVELQPMSIDVWVGYFRLIQLAQIYTMVGEYDEAIDQLDYLLTIPGQLSAPLVRLDPIWAPLRKEPRFQSMLDKHLDGDS